MFCNAVKEHGIGEAGCLSVKDRRQLIWTGMHSAGTTCSTNGRPVGSRSRLPLSYNNVRQIFILYFKITNFDLS